MGFCMAWMKILTKTSHCYRLSFKFSFIGKVCTLITGLIYYILLGRIYSCPEGNGTCGLQDPMRRCPTSPIPPPPPIRIRKTATARGSPWVLLRPIESSTFEELWDGTPGLSSLSEKTRKSNRFTKSFTLFMWGVLWERAMQPKTLLRTNNQIFSEMNDDP